MRFQLMYDISYISWKRRLTIVKSTVTAPMVWLSVISTFIVVLETFLFARGTVARLGALNHERTVLNNQFPYQLLWNYKAQCPVPVLITRDVYHV
jgi:predicted ABC-type sugar transport system permease subunit